jgi:uncharacterized protein GlcG (DUF336 family)
MRICALLLFSLFAASAVAAEPPYVKTRVLSLESANAVAMGAIRACTKEGYQVAVAVVDRNGNLLAFIRNPLAGGHTIQLAKDKAFTAATLQGSTLELGRSVRFLQGVKHISTIGGGVAIKAGGQMYGAVGVSGAPMKKKPGDLDDHCAQEGIKAIQEELEFAS